MLAKDPNAANALQHVAASFARTGHADKAAGIFIDLETESQKTSVQVAMARSYADAGKIKKALAIANTIETMRYKVVVLGHIALVQNKAGDVSAVDETLTRAIELSQEITLPFARSYAFSRLALTLGRLGRGYEAIELCAKIKDDRLRAGNALDPCRRAAARRQCACVRQSPHVGRGRFGGNPEFAQQSLDVCRIGARPSFGEGRRSGEASVRACVVPGGNGAERLGARKGFGAVGGRALRYATINVWNCGSIFRKKETWKIKGASMKFSALKMLAIGGLALSLSACSMFGDDGPPGKCPHVSILADAASITKFRAGQGKDLIDVVYEGEFTGIKASCEYDLDDDTGAGPLHIELTPTFKATIGPAALSKTVSLPYFVAITDSARKVLNRQKFDVDMIFPGNAPAAGLTDEPVTVTIELSPELRGQHFELFLGFDLTKEEIDYNRRRRGQR